MPTPSETKQQFPIHRSLKSLKTARDREVKRILAGEDNRFLAIIGPCSADNEESILDYMYRLAKVAEKIKDKILVDWRKRQEALNAMNVDIPNF